MFDVEVTMRQRELFAEYQRMRIRVEVGDNPRHVREDVWMINTQAPKAGSNDEKRLATHFSFQQPGLPVRADYIVDMRNGSTDTSTKLPESVERVILDTFKEVSECLARIFDLPIEDVERVRKSG